MILHSNSITENMTNPGTATVVGGTTILANFVTALPVLINVAVLTYFTLMIIHKAYQMYKEYREDNRESS